MEPNKKYYKYCRLVFTAILLFHIMGCGNFEMCYDTDDFSTNSEYDSIIVDSSNKNCYYDQGRSYAENENNSTIMRDCLKSKTIDEAGGYYNYSFIKDEGDVDESDIYCKSLDPLNNELENDLGIYIFSGSENVTEVGKNTIFRNCLSFCTEQCDSSPQRINELWTKSNLKTETSYVGIKLKKDTYITVNVSGSITLSDVSTEQKAEFNKYFTDDINYNFTFDDDPISNFDIYVNSDGISSITNNISDILDVSYMDFETFDQSTIVSGKTKDEIYKYTKPHYETVECEYYNSKNENKNSVFCSFKHKNDKSLSENEINNLDNYYNKNYKTSVFADGDYYIYSGDIFNDIKTINLDDYYNFDEEKLKITGFNNCIKIYGSSDCSGYIWTEDNTSLADDNNNNIFSFKLTKASKIAIRYIGTGISDGCEYSISEEYVNSGKNYIDNYVNNYNGLTLDGDKWMVLHDNSTNKNELIFNEFSTINFPVETTVTLKTSNEEKCYSGIVVKIIPLKEFQVKQSGFMFFSVPSIVGGVPQAGKNISYRIINPKAVSFIDENNNSNKISQANMKERFYEQSNSSYSLNSNVSDFSISSSNEPKILDDNYFVRSDQIIRFDYSNFFIFNANNIQSKSIEFNFDETDSSSRGNLDYMIGLNVFIKEKRPLFCYGKSEENINLEKFCSRENGDYQTINTSNDVNKQVCYINNLSCNASDELVEQYYKLNYKKSDCIEETPITSSGNNLNIYDLWDKVYIDYKYITTVGENGATACVSENNGKCLVTIYKSVCSPKYIELIDKIYNEAIKCKNSLANGYNVYSENQNHVKELREKLPDPVTNDTTDKKINYLIDLFKTEEVVSSVDANSSGTYKSNFYYYKDQCTSGNCQDSVTQCYDATNLNISLRTTLSYLQTNNSDLNIIGLSKLQSFDNSSRKGLIKNFLFDTSKEENGYINMYYSNLIYPPNNSFLRMLIINNLDGFTSITDFSQNMRDGNTNVSKAFFKIILDKKIVYKNGDRLAAFIGCDSKLSDYKGDSIIRDTARVMPIVSYKEDVGGIYVFDKDKSLCQFDSSGRLITIKTGSAGIDLTSSIFKEYSDKIDSKSLCGDNKDDDLVFFFKIMDVDNDSSNNEGNYKVDIRAINKTENTIIKYFKSFFNTILSFVDGSDILFLTKNGKKVECGYGPDGNNTCYIYNENYPNDNGIACTAGESNCYTACEENITEDSFTCTNFSDGKGFAKNVYLNFINDPLFQFIAKMALALAITLYGFGYFLGLSNFTQSEIVTKLIRFCMIYFLISPSGWNFFDTFVVRFFKDGIDSILFLIASAFELDVSSDLSIAVSSGNYSDKSVLFSTCFSNIELLFSAPVFNKILGLAFSSWYGLIYLYLVLMTVINYIVGVFSAIIMYLTSQIYMSLVFCFFPLVLLFMFFEKTKKTFDNWLSQLIGFAGQQIFLIMTISFFNILIYNYIKSVFSYKVCWLSIFNVNIAGFPLGAISFWKIPSSSATRGTLNMVDENAPSFYSIMSFYIIGILMSKFVTGAAELGSSIFGGMNIAGGVAGTANSAMNKGAQFLSEKMKGAGAGFYKGVANRVGGKAIEDYKNKRKEETEKRRNFMNSVDEKTDEKMKEEYGDLKKGSKEYEKARKAVRANILKQEITNNGSAYKDDFKKFKNEDSNKNRNNEEVLNDYMKKKGFM